jgi:hypothetical protein
MAPGHLEDDMIGFAEDKFLPLPYLFSPQEFIPPFAGTNPVRF